MGFIALILLLMLINVPVIGDVIAWIVAFWLVAEGAYMLIGSCVSRK